MATIQLTPSSSALLSGSVAVVNTIDLSGGSAFNLTSSGGIDRLGELSGASSVATTSGGSIDRSAEFSGGSSFAAGSSASLQAILSTYGASTFVVRSSAYLENEQLDVWVTTADGLVSRYDGFNFTSFVTVSGRTFGLNDSGLYELAGATDAGQPIKWFLQSAPVRRDNEPQGHGNARPGLGMVMPYQAYVVGMVPRDTELFIHTDKEEVYGYPLESTDGRFNSTRQRLGLGLRTRHFMYGLYGAASSAAELSSVTVLTKDSTRNT